MKAVILAGGLGTRLSEETDARPKPMVEIGSKPMLWHIMKIYSHQGINEFVICLGYRGYMIKEFFANYSVHTSDVTLDIASGRVELLRPSVEPWRVTLIDTGEQTMTGGRLKRVLDRLGDEPFHFTYGDGVADIDLNALGHFHQQSGCLATVTAVPPPGRFGVLRVADSHVTGFEEKPTETHRINGGFFVLSPEVGDYIADDQTVWEREPMERLAAEGQLAGYPHDGFWQCMDTLRDRRYLDDLARGGQAPWIRWP